MRPSRWHSLPAAHDRSPPPRLYRGITASCHRCRRDPCRERAAAMKRPLADAERDRLIAAMLPDVPCDGWSQHALRVAAARIGVPVAEPRALFPRGAIDIVAAFSRWADRQMLDRVEAAPPEPLSLSRRFART